MKKRRYELVSTKEYDRAEGERIFKGFGGGNSTASMVNVVYRIEYKERALVLNLYPRNLTGYYLDWYSVAIKTDGVIKKLNTDCQKDEGSVGFLKVLFYVKRSKNKVLQAVQKRICLYWDSKKAKNLKKEDWKKIHNMSWGELSEY